MAHYARIENNIVVNVLVVDNSIENGANFLSNELKLGGEWVQTSYNTSGGVHANGGTPLNKNYAGIGYTWDGTGFAAPQPFPSWKLNADSYLWEAPTPMPTDGKLYNWNEKTLAWVEVPSHKELLNANN